MAKSEIFLPSDDSDQSVTFAIISAIRATANSLGAFFKSRLEPRLGGGWRNHLPDPPRDDRDSWDPAKIFVFAVNNKDSLAAKHLPRAVGSKSVFDQLKRCHDERNAWFHFDRVPSLLNARATLRALSELSRSVGLSALASLDKLSKRIDEIERGPLVAPDARLASDYKAEVARLISENQILAASAAEAASRTKDALRELEEARRGAVAAGSLEKKLSDAEERYRAAKEAEREADLRAREATEIVEKLGALRSARIDPADLPDVGARWPHGKGATVLRLDRKFEDVIFPSNDLLSDLVGAEIKDTIVGRWFNVLPRGGNIWMDHQGYCCAYDGDQALLFLGQLPPNVS